MDPAIAALLAGTVPLLIVFFVVLRQNKNNKNNKNR